VVTVSASPGGGAVQQAGHMPPVLTALKLTPTAFAPALTGPSIARRAGTRVSYALSEAATTSFVVQRATAGVRHGRSCVRAPRHTRHARRCTRFVPVRGSFTRKGGAGRNSFHFTGRVGGRKLPRGSYRLQATPRAAAGNVGRRVTSQFRISR
jgi:hypothetical protein